MDATVMACLRRTAPRHETELSRQEQQQQQQQRRRQRRRRQPQPALPAVKHMAYRQELDNRRGSFASALSATLAAMMLLARGKGVSGAEITTEYLKPTVSSKACVDTVELISVKTKSLGNDGACMQCDPANPVCPPGCQALIDDLYISCDGVTTPEGLYYDPSSLIEGEWSDKVKARIKIATERCGCDSAPEGVRPLLMYRFRRGSSSRQTFGGHCFDLLTAAVGGFGVLLSWSMWVGMLLASHLL